MQIPTEAQSRINSGSSARPDQRPFSAENATDFLSIVDEALAPDPRTERRRESREAAEDARRLNLREREEDRDREVEARGEGNSLATRADEPAPAELRRGPQIEDSESPADLEPAPLLSSAAPRVDLAGAPGAAVGDGTGPASSLPSAAIESSAASSSALRDPLAAASAGESEDQLSAEGGDSELGESEASGDPSEGESFADPDAEGERLFDFAASKKSVGAAGQGSAAATGIPSALASGDRASNSGAQTAARGGETAPLEALSRRESAAAARSAPAARASLQAIEIDRVVEQIKLHTRPGISRIQMIIDPPELGRLSIRLSLRGDQLVGRVAVESAELLQQLREQLPALREAMSEAGVDVRDFEFTQEEPPGERAGDADQQGPDGENVARRDPRQARIYGESRRGAARLALGQRAVDDGLDVVV
jgi:flagellar hook-length control protein FliK